MEETLDRLKKKRTPLKTMTTKLMNKTESTLKDRPQDVDAMEECLAQLKRKEADLANLNDEVLKLVEDSELEKEMETTEEYKEKIISWITKLELHIRRANDGIKTSGTSTDKTGKPSSIPIKLPSLSISNFNGDSSNWQNFWAQYNSAIHENESLKNVDKFNYLKTFLSGAALTAINGLNLTDENYEVAITILKDRFGRKDLVIGSHMHNLLNLNAVKRSSDVQALRNLYDSLEIQIRSLQTLGIDSSAYSSLLCPILLKNIPEDIALQFHRQREEDSEWEVNELLQLLKREVESRERTKLLTNNTGKADATKIKEKSGDEPKSWKKHPGTVASATALQTITDTECLFCQQTSHSTDNCEMSIEDKKRALLKQGRCFLCFKKHHRVRQCKYRRSCKSCNICNLIHHPSLCEGKNGEQAGQSVTVASVSQNEHQNDYPCLQTVRASIINEGRSLPLRCLLDSGSQTSFIRQDISRQLKLTVLGTETLSINVFGSEKPTKVTRRRVQVFLKNSKFPDKSITIEALETPEISSTLIPVPSKEFVNNFKIEGLQLSDQVSNENEPLKLSLLIGTDFYWSVVTGNIKRLGTSTVALETIFGWCIHGPTPVLCGFGISNEINAMKILVTNELDDDLTSTQLRKFWELESLGIDDETSEKNCEQEVRNDFESSIKYQSGRYEVRLPWKSDLKMKLKDNRTVAETRLHSLNRRLKRDPLLYCQYQDVIADYLKRGIIEPVNLIGTRGENPVFYLPHKPVLKNERETTKLRIVFDASSHQEGRLSLNNCLHSGPNLNPELFDLLLKFRENRIAFTSDIEKAFLQVELAPEDRDATRFLWNKNIYGNPENNSISIYRFTRVLFGVTSSPFLLGATIKHHITKHREDYPETYKLLNDNLYVDDLIGGANTDEDAQKLCTESSAIMEAAGMPLRKWRTNSETLRENWKVENEKTNSKTFCDSITPLKVLGMAWDPENDVIYFDMTNLLEFITKRIDTKRFILQAAGRIFDPLGLLTPFTIRIKCIFQELWIEGIKWDQSLPDRLQKNWENWCKELPILNEVKIQRYYFDHDSTDATRKIEIHCFSDASQKAYGSVIYLKIGDTQGNASVSLVCSRTRVAPIKQVSLPRLELLGALISARLVHRVQDCLTLKSTCFLWTDSEIVLYWIKGDANKYKQFVKNRVNEIQSLTNPSDWNHCPGKDNPADLLSRGTNASTLINGKLWWHGPEWLKFPKHAWPGKEKFDLDIKEDQLEIKKTILQSNCIVEREFVPVIDIERYSSFNKLLRVTAWVFRFIKTIKEKRQHGAPNLTAEEIRSSKIYLLKEVQFQHYKKEIQALKNRTKLEKMSEIFTLNPKLDEDGLMCIGGRIQGSELNIEEKHPVILPTKNKLTELIIRAVHQRVMHGGVAATLSQIRLKYWIPRGRQEVKKQLNRCLTCKKYSAKPGTEIEAPLPRSRVHESPPFENTGVDFAGPIYTRHNGREKSYIAIFTCAVTRAIHLELVSNLSSDNFLLALRRFLARRGHCSTLYSDNALTFKGAERELKEMYNIIKNTEIQNFMATKEISFKYIIPNAPFWGGFWERMVRAVKTCLRKTLGRASLTFEELTTVLTETEAVLNSRPLTFLYSDSNEPEALTPSQFLCGKELTGIPSHYVPKLTSTKEELIKRKKYRHTLMKKLWVAWKKLYLMDLRSAHHQKGKPNDSAIRENDYVLIEDDKKPRLFWRTGLITKTYPGRDGKIRSCDVKTTDGILKRPIQHLYSLELNF